MQELCFADFAHEVRAPAAPPAAHLIARYGGNVPRYTSYPTAAQFKPKADDSDHRAWLREVPAGRPVSLYLHIPFCERLCWYCGCNTSVAHSRAPVETYVGTLIKEIDLAADALPHRLAVSALHFGGGTPNMLSPANLEAIIGTVRRRFDLLPAAEIAAELDPGSLTPSWVEAAKALGLNRASLGVQDFDPLVQQAINRSQSFECVASCVGWLRDAGVPSINLDLIYGLPHQTVPGLLTTVRQAASLAPDRVALFGYAHVPWMKPAQTLLPEKALPSPEDRFAQAQAAAEQLQSMGYMRVGLDHFARSRDSLARADAEGTLRRNFQGYTTDTAVTLLGFGASSISHLPDGYVQNHTSVPAWRACIETERLPTSRGVGVTDDDRARAAVIEALMCALRVDLRDIAAAHLLTRADRLNLLGEDSLAELHALEEDGLVEVEQDSGEPVILRVTEAGRPFVRNVCALFDAYLRSSAGRHSAGV